MSCFFERNWHQYIAGKAWLASSPDTEESFTGLEVVEREGQTSAGQNEPTVQPCG